LVVNLGTGRFTPSMLDSFFLSVCVEEDLYL